MADKKKRIEDFTYPTRDKIRAELLKVSDFTREEVEKMGYNKLYSAYGKIARYGQQGVEDIFRTKD